MKKRMIALFLMVVLVLSASMASAAVLRAAKRNRVTATISLNSGKVEATCKGTVQSGCTSSVKVYVQRMDTTTGEWKTMSTGTGTKDASTSATATSGYSYRAYATLKVYDGNDTLIDSVSGSSAPLNY